MATIVKFEFVGFKELQEVFNELGNDFGPKDQNNILRSGVRKAMAPVLATARTLVPVDTGALHASLQTEARKPTNKDRRSKYITATDTVIGVVTTASGRKLANKTFTHAKTKQKVTGIPSDGRANFMEYGFDHYAREVGTAAVPAQPFMRPALESNSQNVVDSLAAHLRTAITKYKARQAKKGTR
jgi:HK97 gp10 family phage protein